MMNICAMVFDIDETLSPLGHPVSRETADGLCTLARRGYRVGFASGKSCPYIEGFARAIGLQSYFALGENGAVYMDTYNGHAYPLAKRPVELDALQAELTDKYQDVYFQCNFVNLSIFCEDLTKLNLITEFVRSRGWMRRDDVTVYIHPDCIDIMPSGVDKGTGIAYLKKRSGWETSEVLAVGDSINDVPMTREAGLFYAVGNGLAAKISFENSAQMMRYLLSSFPERDI